jgi:hypothetical protein
MVQRFLFACTAHADDRRGESTLDPPIPGNGRRHKTCA